MTEHEWLTRTEPLKMLDWLTGLTGERESVSDRRLRLFACACCRQSWHLLTDERSRRAVEVAERHADGKATEEERMLAGRESGAAWSDVDNSDVDDIRRIAAGEACECLSGDAVFAARYVAVPRHIREPASDANLLRSIVGNPFRPLLRTSTDIYQTHGVNVVWRFRVPQSVVTLATVAYEQRLETPCQRCYGQGTILEERGVSGEMYIVPCMACQERQGPQTYNTPKGTGKLPTGQLDPHNLSILADALEDAGCDNAEVLSGLRSPEPRYRGWHVLDVILGKE